MFVPKNLAAAGLSSILAFTVFTAPSSSSAGFLDPIIKTGGDILSGGGSARQRDWEACERDKNSRINELTKQIGDHDAKIVALVEMINGFNNQIKQADQEKEFTTSQGTIIESMFLTSRGFEAQQGMLDQVILALHAVMDENKQATAGLNNWRVALEDLLLEMNVHDLPAAQLLLSQIRFAAASRDASVIQNIIQVLRSPNQQNLKALSVAWASLMQSQKARLNQINALQAELREKVKQASDGKAKIEAAKTKLDDDLRNTKAKNC